MRTMRCMSQMLAVILFASLAACSDDTDSIDNGKEPSKAEAYATISITLPNGAETRAASAEDSGETPAPGTEEEYKVHKATLYFFAAQGETNAGNLIKAIEITTFSKDATSDGSIVYTSVPVGLSLGKYNVYAIANGEATVVENGGSGSVTTEANFKNFTLGSSGENGTLTNLTGTINIATSGILMTSRSSAGVICQENVEIKAEHTATSPCPIALDMERALAKITYIPAGDNSTANTNNKFDVKQNSTTIATVELTNYELLNLRKNSYVFRHVGTATGAASTGTFGKIDATNTYVIDPKTTAKTYTGGSMATSYEDWYDNSTKTNITINETLPTGNSAAMAYCMENTMLKDNQKQGYTTGIVFKGQITPMTGKYFDGSANTYTSGDLYYYNGNFYSTLDVLKQNNTFSNAASITDANLSDYGISKYLDGKCYYFYWIKHFPNASTSEMGVMEYGIVRNNDYQVKVSSINSLGKEAATYTPADDDKKSEVYIQVKLTVRPWTVRKNDAVLGR